MSELVTVVIPTRNRLPLLLRTLASVRAQEAVDLEVVIVDESSDIPVEAAIGPLQDERVRVVRHAQPLGVAAARNRGVRESRGRFIAFLDDDDIWAGHKLRAQLDALAEKPALWAYTGAVKFVHGPVVWQVMPPPDAERTRQMLAHKCIVPAGASNVLVETDHVQRLGGFDESLGHLADWDLWLRLLEQGPPAVVPGFGVGYRLHPDAMSLNPQGILAELDVIDRRWRHLRDGQSIDAAPTHLWIATSWLRAGHRWRAANSYARAVRTRPRQAIQGALRTLYPPVPGPARDPLTRAWPMVNGAAGADAVGLTDQLVVALRTWGDIDRAER